MLRFPGTPSFICIEAVSEYRKSYAVVEISIHLCTPQCKSVYLPLFAEGRLAQRIIGSCSMPINIDNRTEALNFDLIFFLQMMTLLYSGQAKAALVLNFKSNLVGLLYSLSKESRYSLARKCAKNCELEGGRDNWIYKQPPTSFTQMQSRRKYV